MTALLSTLSRTLLVLVAGVTAGCGTASTPESSEATDGAASAGAPGTQDAEATLVSTDSPAQGPPRVERTEDEWRELLSDEEFRILRAAGTERAFTGKYWDDKTPGTFQCAGCQLPLFGSETKFKSGTGWPSFWEPLDPANVVDRTDRKHGMIRTEVVCGACDGHLGHVFPDGPEPTGLRYCINSASLVLAPEAQQP